MFVIKHKKWFVGFSILLVVASLAIIFIKGFKLGIDFQGGTVAELSYPEGTKIDTITLGEQLAANGFEGAKVQALGTNKVLVRSTEISEENRTAFLDEFTIGEQAPTVERFDTISPSVSKELKTKSIIALILVSAFIVCYIAYSFRKVQGTVSSWYYGLAIVLAIVHDVVIPAAIFAFFGKEVDTLFVVGLLSVVGLSVNDSIVVFDRIRENLSRANQNEADTNFQGIVGRSLSQTVVRSLATSLAVIAVLISLVVVGPESTMSLAEVLLIGMIAGTYSSIFFASPALVMLSERFSKKK
ncbi:MAG TPA: protein translocase subunit SecF [Candidatus Paceibacterota bacterium]